MRVYLMSRLLGLVLLAVGIVLLGFGMNSSHAVTEKVVEGVTGRYTDNTMWYIISGIAMIVGGGVLALIGKPRE
jgi:uncharacterized membrane protein YidH (DUF202 family)